MLASMLLLELLRENFPFWKKTAFTLLPLSTSATASSRNAIRVPSPEIAPLPPVAFPRVGIHEPDICPNIPVALRSHQPRDSEFSHAEPARDVEILHLGRRGVPSLPVRIVVDDEVAPGFCFVQAVVLALASPIYYSYEIIKEVE